MDTKFSGGPLEVRLYTDIPEFAFLMSHIREMKLKYDYVEVREYTKKEIQEAEYYAIGILPYPYEHDPEKNAEYFGTKYDGDIAQLETRNQISPLYVDVKKFLKYKIASIIPERLIPEKTKKEFEENGFMGVGYGDVIDYKGRDFCKFYQFFVNSILPPLELIDLAKEMPFERIGTYVTKFYHFNKVSEVYVRTEYVYNKDDFKDAKDFNLTKEWFWGGNYHSQTLIVSKRVYNWLKSTKHRIPMEPIRFKQA